jgi:hypothetical protein
MALIVSILLGILLMGGVVRLVLFFVRRTDLLIQPDRTLGNRRLIALGILSIVFSAFGLFLLSTKAYDPVDILIGVSLVVLLSEVAFRKGSINWSGQ